jgi:hypothetical protein
LVKMKEILARKGRGGRTAFHELVRVLEFVKPHIVSGSFP